MARSRVDKEGKESSGKGLSPFGVGPSQEEGAKPHRVVRGQGRGGSDDAVSVEDVAGVHRGAGREGEERRIGGTSYQG